MRVGNASRRCDDRLILGVGDGTNDRFDSRVGDAILGACDTTNDRFDSLRFYVGGRSDVIRFDSILGLILAVGGAILGLGDASG
jgi:hypothetical protein